jgi:hypothetical protein
MSTPRPRALLFAALLVGTAFGIACDKVPLFAPTQATITLIPSTTVVAANGTATIIASVIEQSGTPVQNGTVVTFTSSFGTIAPREASTTNGQATVEFRGSGQSGTAKIGAFSGGIKATDLEILVGGAAADRVLLRAEPATVVTSGSTVQLVATVLDASGNGLSGVPVTFTANNGTLLASQVLTDGSGIARTSLTTNRNTSVSANAGNKSATLELTAVTAPSVTIALAGNTAAEAGAPLTFTVTPPSGGLQLTGVTINWGDGTTTQLGAIAAATQVAHTYAQPGQYTITATGNDAGGNSASTTLVLAVTERSTVPVTITASPATPSLAGGGLVNFTVSTGGVGTGAGAIRFYEWEFGDGSSTVTTGPAVSHRYSAQGNYTVRVRVTTTTGAEGFGQTQVRVGP